MPRHNRRAPQQSAPPIRKMSHAERMSLVAFARDHLAAHADNVVAWAELDDKRGWDRSLCVTGSEHPATGYRFLSAGDRSDPVAVRLVAVSEPSPSDGGGNLAA